MNITLQHACRFLSPGFSQVLEFGVFTGGTIRQLRKQLDSRYQIFGFDSFEGLPEDWSGTNCLKGDMSTEGKIPEVEGVEFYKGWFKDTIPRYKEVNAGPIALLHVDCDLYSSTVEVLYGLSDRIVPGTVIVFDEWYYNHRNTIENRQHEQKAFFEWTKDTGSKFTIFPQLEDERIIVRIES